MEKIILEIHQAYSNLTQRLVVAASRAVVGRGYHCDVILDDPYVSEEHFEIVLAADGRFIITDKGSENGIFAGHRNVAASPFTLESGQEIKVGRTHIKILSSRHAIPPARQHNRLSTVQGFMDRRGVGVLLSVLCAASGICLAALSDADDPDFWKSYAYGVGGMILFFICIAWSAIHICLVVFNRKHMPWPRIVSYVSVALLAFMVFFTLVLPYIDFYLLSGWQVLAASAGLLFVFFVISEYGFRAVCEMPFNFFRISLYAALAAILFTLPDFGYSPMPVFPETIITADMPLFRTQPLDGFIEQALATTSR